MTLRTLGVAVFLGVVAFQLTGCYTVERETAEKSVADVVFSHKGVRPDDVTCPSGVDAKVGTEFECHYTGPDGTPYTAHMKITKSDGEHVEFDVILPS